MKSRRRPRQAAGAEKSAVRGRRSARALHGKAAGNLMANVLLITIGTGGDILPFLRIGKALKARGHAPTVLTNSQFADLVRQAALEFRTFTAAEERDRTHEEGDLQADVP